MTAGSGAGVHDPGCRMWGVSYPATVKAFHSYENSYDLDYEDGDSETRVPARLIRPLATAAPRDLIPTPLTTTSQAPPPTDVETGGEL